MSQDKFKGEELQLKVNSIAEKEDRKVLSLKGYLGVVDDIIDAVTDQNHALSPEAFDKLFLFPLSHNWESIGYADAHNIRMNINTLIHPEDGKLEWPDRPTNPNLISQLDQVVELMLGREEQVMERIEKRGEGIGVHEVLSCKDFFEMYGLREIEVPGAEFLQAVAYYANGESWGEFIKEAHLANLPERIIGAVSQGLPDEVILKFGADMNSKLVRSRMTELAVKVATRGPDVVESERLDSEIFHDTLLKVAFELNVLTAYINAKNKNKD